MVSNATLATICVLTGLYEYLQFASSDLATQITLYATKIRALHDEEHSSAAKEQRLPRQFWVEIEPPKVSTICSNPIATFFHAYNTVGPFRHRRVRYGRNLCQ